MSTLFAIWLAATPYKGIVHDAVLYTAQALRRLNPGNLSNDPFFLFQSQDNFTIFTSIYARFIDWFGLFASAKALTLIGKIFWFAGLICFSHAVIPHRSVLYALALVITLPGYYDGYWLLTYGESFVTSRLFAEAFSMGALGAWYTRWRRAAIGLIGIALILHPIMAFPALLCIGYDTIRRRHVRVAPLACLIVTLSTIAFLLRPGLLSALTQTIDGEWLYLLEKRNPYLFLDNWGDEWIGKLVVLAGVAIVARRILSKRLRTLTEWQFLVPPLLIGFTVIGSGLLHNVLLTQMQLQRVFWLAQITGILLLVRLALKSANPATSASTRYLCAIAVFAGLIQGTAGAMILAFYSIGYQLYRKLQKNTSYVFSKTIERYRPPVMYCLCGLVIILEILRILEKWNIESSNIRSFADHLKTAFLVFFTSTTACILFVWVSINQHFPILFRIKSTVILVLLCITTAIAFYRWNKEYLIHVEPGQTISIDARKALQKAIPEGATVYWPGEVLETWLWLERPFYASWLQGAGWVFSRDTALETHRRQKYLLKLGFNDGDADWDRQPQPEPRPKMTLKEKTQALCADPVLKFVILPKDTSEHTTLTFDTKTGLHFDLLDCKHYR